MNQKEKTQAFTLAVNTRNTAEIEQLVQEDYIQHNPFVPSGRQAFIGLVPVLEEQGTEVETIRLIEDGPYVVMHNHWKKAAPFGADQMISFDLIRFDANGKIAEHWDVLTALTPPNASGRTLIDGETTIKNLNETEQNRALITNFIENAIQAKPEAFEAILKQSFHPIFLQHNPGAGDGISSLLEAIQQRKVAFTFEKLHLVLAEGNFVLSVTEGTHFEKPAVFYDLFRIDQGKIVEHWDVIQAIPTENLANENTMFNFPQSTILQ